jgi:TonB family protein
MVVAFALAVSLPAFAFGKDKKQAEAEALLAKARELSDIRCDGCPAFHLEGTLRVFDPTGSDIGGLYKLRWSSKSLWREEVVLPDYRETRVRSGKDIWVQRSSGIYSWQLSVLRSALDPARRLLVPVEDVASVVERDVPGLDDCCVVADLGKPYRHELWFDLSRGLLVREHLDTLVHENSEYSSTPRSFPRRTHAEQDGRPLVDFRLERFASPVAFDGAVFELIRGEGVFRTCETPAPPKAANVRQPGYPKGRRKERIEGIVLLFFTVTEDGRVRYPQMIKALHPEFDSASLKAVTKWRFEPATCEGEPTQADIVGEIRFKPQ